MTFEITKFCIISHIKARFYIFPILVHHLEYAFQILKKFLNCIKKNPAKIK